MKTIDYDEKESANTESLIATDEKMENKFGNIQRAYNEGFASSDGVRGETADTSGEITVPESGDTAEPGKAPSSIESENPGLAD